MQKPITTGVMLVALSGLFLAAVYLIQAPGSNGKTRGEASGTGSRATGDLSGFQPGDGRILADFAFRDGEGREVRLSDWRGRVVLLNLWATWCAPCREEMPVLDQLQARLGGEDFEVVALSLDRGGADRPQAFLNETGAKNLAFYHDNSMQAFVALGAFGMPVTFLVGRRGEHLGTLVGAADWISAEALALVESARAGHLVRTPQGR